MADNVFARQLKERNPDPEGRRWIYVPYDQLTDRFGPLAQAEPEEVGIVLIENPWKASRRPYHRQKLAWILASLRHFALEQAERGVAVRHVVTNGPYREPLAEIAAELDAPVTVMEPAERELRADLAPLEEEGLLEVVAHEGWLTTPEDFRASQKGNKTWRMDSFYRYLRKKTGILMEDGEPTGGKYSFDDENRESWDGEPAAPELPEFEVGPVTAEVGELIESNFSRHPGRLHLPAVAATLEDAERFWTWARRECLEHFGPYEDAMSTRSGNLFHTRLSTLLNLFRLEPRRVLEEALELDVPLNSKEGFVRQLIGWREFMRHVHRETDGFRDLAETVAKSPGDGGYGQWKGEPWPREASSDEPDGGAEPSFLGSGQPLPPAYWGEESGLSCLDHVVAQVWEEGFTHHIPRLMVLSNLATLLDIDPRQLTDWFWAAFTDAFDWVVEPNVLGMGTFALGDRFTTKPYVSGSPYIDRMSDFCGSCAFDPKKDCPITPLYWAFLERHREQLADNPRMRMIYGTLKRRDEEKRSRDSEIHAKASSKLAKGEKLTPDSFDG